MGRNIGRHTDRNATSAVDQHIGVARRQNGGFFVFAVVVILKINRVFFNIGQHKGGGLVHADFGVAHGGGVIAIHRAKIALTIQQRQRHREILSHPHKRVIDRAIAMRVVFTHHIPHRAGGFSVRLVVGISSLVHGIKNASMNRFQTVTQVRNGTAHDHAHGIIEIGCAHLVFDGHGRSIMNHIFVSVFFFVFRCFWRIAHVGARFCLAV